MPQGTQRLDALWCRSAEHVSADVDEDSAVVLQTKTGVYYEIGRVSRRIWELAAQPISISALCDILMREYDVERERCEADVAKFLEQLANAGLLTLSTPSHTASEARP